MLRPMGSFLCCMPLGQAVRAVMVLHLLQCFYTCALAIGNVVTVNDTVSHGTSVTSQILSAAWSLIGIPVCLVGIWGSRSRGEPHVRLYLYYLIACVAIDVAYLVNLFLVKDACVHLDIVAMARGGQAFACGVARAISGASAVVLTVALLYVSFAVWSHCEELAGTSIADRIGDLLASAEGKQKAGFFSHMGFSWKDSNAEARRLWDASVPPRETTYGNRLGSLDQKFTYA
mmetsp:Transcript_22117/g.56440  ORF Transcript_22117/g.56440 Transcript_22117/m.56440 type:complete len:231 (+) Transcript_22117:135-827(+)